MIAFDLAACVQLRGTGPQDYFIIALLPVFTIITLLIRRQPPFSGKRFFLTANWALTAWLFTVAMELLSADPGCKVLWGMLAYPWISLLPVAWFLFVWRYGRGETGRIARWQWALLIGVPACGALAALSSPLTGLFYAPGTAPSSPAPGAPIAYVYGPLFYANAAVLYGFLLGSFVLLGRGIARAAGISRLLYVMLFAMTALPSLANVGYVAFGINIAGFDPTPFLFSFVLLAYAAIMSLSNFFQISAIAKDMIFDGLPSPIVVVANDGRIMASNAQAQALMPAAAAADATVWNVASLADLMTLAISGERLSTPPEVRIGDGLFEVSLTPVRDTHRIGTAGTMGFAFVFFEVTQRKALQASLAAALDATDAKLDAALIQNRRIADEVRTDPLTGLLNRRALTTEFEAMTAAGAARIFAVMVDIDHFKAINDTQGHARGDDVLIALGTCLQRAFRDSDRVFRMGGEEFLILLPDMDAATLEARIARLRRDSQIAGDMLLPSTMPLRFSAGVAAWPTDAETLTDLLDSADRRLYTSKSTGRNKTSGPLTETG
ncbi:diguanylate cyclase (GGDEF) domain-containing protein [Loktanella fryxellensis]|uniref:diguanylate cyclase n=1 Tax=Loktanella fryxellensis TaxID=245187 RepID=A0A1H8GNR0_9RHOB|nr:diguanylate cyclase [Loktanella fryxellensis]SEN45137.1 diguanylate cyclase (GGDEF) domain-containing protein [Loktanella fryxellensis]